VSALGTPYRYGGTGPGGFDCSGLVRWAYGHAGVALPRTTYEQRSASRPVGALELLPGDLVFYNGTSHVGLFIGDGKVIHAPRSGRSVEVVDLERNGMRPSGFTRVL
jgi:cell wall-associated NlpC family hydrolase